MMVLRQGKARRCMAVTPKWCTENRHKMEMKIEKEEKKLE